VACNRNEPNKNWKVERKHENWQEITDKKYSFSVKTVYAFFKYMVYRDSVRMKSFGVEKSSVASKRTGLCSLLTTVTIANGGECVSMQSTLFY
jgi:hypothetical protein